MRTAFATVTGKGLGPLVPSLRGELGDCLEYLYGDVVVMFYEKYSLRVNSSLMVSIILDFTVPGRCNIKIVSGGGSAGLLRVTWGSEDSRIKEVLGSLQRICASNGWQLTADKA